MVATAADGPTAVRAAVENRPDVAVLDIRMPPTHTTEGLVAAREIRQQLPSTAVLVLSQYVEPSYALDLISSYPERLGYLLRSAS